MSLACFTLPTPFRFPSYCTTTQHALFNGACHSPCPFAHLPQPFLPCSTSLARFIHCLFPSCRTNPHVLLGGASSSSCSPASPDFQSPLPLLPHDTSLCGAMLAIHYTLQPHSNTHPGPLFTAITLHYLVIARQCPNCPRKNFAHATLAGARPPASSLLLTSADLLLTTQHFHAGVNEFSISHTANNFVQTAVCLSCRVTPAYFTVFPAPLPTFAYRSHTSTLVLLCQCIQQFQQQLRSCPSFITLAVARFDSRANVMQPAWLRRFLFLVGPPILSSNQAVSSFLVHILIPPIPSRYNYFPTQSQCITITS